MMYVQINSHLTSVDESIISFNANLLRKFKLQKLQNYIDISSILKYIEYLNSIHITIVRFEDDIAFRSDYKMLLKLLLRFDGINFILHSNLDSVNFNLPSHIRYEVELPTTNYREHLNIYPKSKLTEKEFNERLETLLYNRNCNIIIPIYSNNIDNYINLIDKLQYYEHHAIITLPYASSPREVTSNKLVNVSIDTVKKIVSYVNNMSYHNNKIQFVGISRCLLDDTPINNVIFTVTDKPITVMTPSGVQSWNNYSEMAVTTSQECTKCIFCCDKISSVLGGKK